MVGTAKLDPRRVLNDLIKDRGETYASVSRLLSRNSAYVQQYIKRGSPAQLDDDDIAQLAAHFGVSAVQLGGRDVPETKGQRAVAIPILGLTREEEAVSHVRLVDEQWLRTITRKPTGISLVRVAGDAMAPTLRNGDEVMIQRHQANENLRDGIYVIRADTGLLVRRITLEPTRRRLSVLTDNPAYPTWGGLQRNSLEIVGRVAWASRRLS